MSERPTFKGLPCSSYFSVPVPDEPWGSLFLSSFFISFITFFIISWTGLYYLVDSSLVHQLDSFTFPLSFLMFLSVLSFSLSSPFILLWYPFFGSISIYFPLSFPFPLSSWCAVDLVVGRPFYIFLHFLFCLLGRSSKLAVNVLRTHSLVLRDRIWMTD